MRFSHLADCHIGSWRDEKLNNLSTEAFTMALDINPVLIGNSFGGRLVLEYAIRKKKPETKIILLNSCGAGLRRNKLIFAFSILFNSMYELSFHKGFLPTLGIMKNWSIKFFNNMAKDNFWNFFGEMLFTDVSMLPDLDTDCVLLWGERDSIIKKEYAVKLSKMIKNSRLIFVKGGHFSCINNPQLFSERIGSLLDNSIPV